MFQYPVYLRILHPSCRAVSFQPEHHYIIYDRLSNPRVLQANQRPSRRDERAYRPLLLARPMRRSTTTYYDCLNVSNNPSYRFLSKLPRKNSSSTLRILSVCRGHHTTLTSRRSSLAYGAACRRRVPNAGLLSAHHTTPSHTTPIILLLQHVPDDWPRAPKSP